MDLKFLSGIIAGIIGLTCFIPYLIDIFRRKTKPHIYSWLIWSITQSTAVIAMIVGNAQYGSLGLAVGSLFCISIFFLSFKYGTKDITRFDTFCLIGAIFAVILWIVQKNPLYSVTLITIIDSIGFIPTYRKSYIDPYSETILFYLLTAASNFFAIIAIANYTIITTLYIATLASFDTICALLLIIRRRMLAKDFNHL